MEKINDKLLKFKFDNQPISVIKDKNEIWFKAEYVDTKQAIQKKCATWGVDQTPQVRNVKFINESDI